MSLTLREERGGRSSSSAILVLNTHVRVIWPRAFHLFRRKCAPSRITPSNNNKKLFSSFPSSSRFKSLYRSTAPPPLPRPSGEQRKIGRTIFWQKSTKLQNNWNQIWFFQLLASRFIIEVSPLGRKLELNNNPQACPL